MARGHEQPGDLGEIGDQIVGDAVAEKVLVRIAGLVGEGQHRDRRSLGRSWRRCRRGPRHHHAIHPHRPLDVLEPPLADIFELAVEPAAHVIVGGARDGHAARLAQLLEPGGDVHPIAVDAALLGEDVGEVDPDPEIDPLGPRDVPLALGDATLDGDGTLDRIDHARELAQRIVAGEVDDPAVMLGDQGLEQLAPARLEASERAGIVATHEPRVADHIRDQDRGKPALRAGNGHRAASKLLGAQTYQRSARLSYARSHRLRNRCHQCVMSNRRPALWALLYLRRQPGGRELAFQVTGVGHVTKRQGCHPGRAGKVGFGGQGLGHEPSRPHQHVRADRGTRPVVHDDGISAARSAQGDDCFRMAPRTVERPREDSPVPAGW